MKQKNEQIIFFYCFSNPFLRNSIISMITLSDFFQQQQSITLQELQNRVFSNKAKRREQTRSPPPASQPTDLKILSPFYQRIIQHPKNCKCMYHKRIRSQIKTVGRYRTQQSQFCYNCKEMSPGEHGLQNWRPELLEIGQNILEQSSNTHAREGQLCRNTEQFKKWMQKMSTEELNKNYLEYLKSLPNLEKTKRHIKLDCHNLAFEQFLKSRHLVILDKKKSQHQILSQNKENHSRRLASKVRTEGNIEKDKIQTNKTLNHRFTEVSEKGHPSMKDTHKKKIGFKGTENNFELSDEEDPGDRKQKRKRTKFISSRPSFFGLIEDQQILKQLCMRFMTQNRAQNKQAELMLKQLVQSDLDMYMKIMNDIEEDIQQGIFVKNLDQNTTNKLIKIVLHKLSKSIQTAKAKDQSYEEKSNIIEDLCNKFGWSQEEKPIGLPEFWKITQSMKQYQSRRSLAADKGSKIKLERGESLGNPNKLDKNNKNRSKLAIRESRMSGFSGQKSLQKFNNPNFNNSCSKTIIFKGAEEQNEPQKELPQEQFKFSNTQSKNILKKGGLMKRKRGKKLSTFQNGDSFMKNKFSGNGLVRKQTYFYKVEDNDEKQTPNAQDHAQNERFGLLTDNNTPKADDDRNSSMFLYLKSHVLRHIQVNKKFLKRIENQLMDKECSQFVIGIGTGILTKKRKIRAIYDALQKQKDKESGYYHDLLKYLEIYEEYCDLVVKVKKQKKSNKSEGGISRFAEGYLLERNEEDVQQLNNLLEDLRKQRELKYIDLKWMQEQEDPKEELIIKMPEYNTQVDKLYEKRKKLNIKEERQKVQVKFIEFQPLKSTIMQKNLEYRVSMTCEIDSNNLRHTIGEECLRGDHFQSDQVQEYDNSATTRELSSFQKKMLNYRKQLKLLTDNDDI